MADYPSSTFRDRRSPPQISYPAVPEAGTRHGQRPENTGPYYRHIKEEEEAEPRLGPHRFQSYYPTIPLPQRDYRAPFIDYEPPRRQVAFVPKPDIEFYRTEFGPTGRQRVLGVFLGCKSEKTWQHKTKAFPVSPEECRNTTTIHLSVSMARLK
jgi:hypothetical protein